mmetsp:Transcript_17103/g.42433  ORF Transcript_17103/g.42433 Transcript_17103/m.42433 type:complete len:213 (+) Transcript_17103:6278-6916(+)
MRVLLPEGKQQGRARELAVRRGRGRRAGTDVRRRGGSADPERRVTRRLHGAELRHELRAAASPAARGGDLQRRLKRRPGGPRRRNRLGERRPAGGLQKRRLLLLPGEPGLLRRRAQKRVRTVRARFHDEFWTNRFHRLREPGRVLQSPVRLCGVAAQRAADDGRSDCAAVLRPGCVGPQGLRGPHLLGALRRGSDVRLHAELALVPERRLVQ